MFSYVNSLVVQHKPKMFRAYASANAVNRRLCLNTRNLTTVNRLPQSIQWRNIRGVIGDLGDTVIPGGPMIRALQGAFVDVFNLSISTNTIYQGFGMPKHQQIREILSKTPRPNHGASKSNGNFPFERDVDIVHAQFEQRLVEFYKKNGVQYLPGTYNALVEFNRRGIRVGATTGLSSRVIEQIELGLPGVNHSVAPIYPIVHCERPSPQGIYKILELWNRSIPPSQHIKLHQCIKVGDSMSDLAEAKAAGIPFVGISHHRSRSSLAEKQYIEYEFLLNGAVCTVGTLDELYALLSKK